MPSPPPQPVPAQSTRSKAAANLVVPLSSSRPGVSPSSYGAMTGISFTNGGGFSFEGPSRSKWGNGVGSYGARFYGDGYVRAAIPLHAADPK